MREYLPILIAGGIIGAFTLAFVLAYAAPENIGPDLMVDLSHLLQQFDHAGNVPGFRFPDLHNHYLVC